MQTTTVSTLPASVREVPSNDKRALKRFKKKCEKAGILSDLRRHQHFEKPSERRKRKLNAAKRKSQQRKA